MKGKCEIDIITVNKRFELEIRNVKANKSLMFEYIGVTDNCIHFKEQQSKLDK